MPVYEVEVEYDRTVIEVETVQVEADDEDGAREWVEDEFFDFDNVYVVNVDLIED